MRNSMNPKDDIKKHPDPATTRSCIRCGACCEKGGPAFHIDDKHLIESGIIPLRDLFTIRKNEPIYDNVKGCIFLAPSDVIKIKNRPPSSACIYFDENRCNCRIYKNRPIECRSLECWDTQEFEKRYAVDRLTRKDLLLETKDLWQLVSDHEKRCGYEEINRILGPIGEKPLTAVPPSVREMARYDIHLRNLLAEKGGFDPALMDFLFGTPLEETLKRYGIQVNVGDQVI
jgi:Fe-S-cluster containining protein